MVQVYPLRVGDNRSFINYTYLVVDAFNKEAIIVDPGWEREIIIDTLIQTQCCLKGILLTHHHFDHAQLAPDFASLFDVPVFINAMEKDMYNFTCPNLIVVDSDECIIIGKFAVTAYHTPGHTLGSMCYLIDDNLFTGDTLFIEGCGICNTEGAAAMYHSLKKLQTHIHPLTKIFPGHSYGRSPGVEFKSMINDNIYFHMNDIKQFVAFRTRKNQTRIFDFK